MMVRSIYVGAIAMLAAVLFGPVNMANAQTRILTGEQIENKLFAKSKAISPVRRKAVDMNAVTFEYNSATLTGPARRQLDVLGRVLSKPAFRGNKFVIGGHTDDSGSEAYNKTLSQRRAQSVVQYLTRNYEIKKSALTPVGYGESRLISSLNPDDPSQRRAEIINIGKGD